MFVALALGVVQVCGNLQRNLASGDATAYLDIADAYGRGQWSAAINAFWSPLYSWLLEIFLLLFKPSPRSELRVVSLANLFIYAAALVCFHLFLREWIRFQRLRAETGNDATCTMLPRVTLPIWMWHVVGYSLFIWSSLELNFVARISPDMLVSALVFAACAILLRVRGRGDAGWPLFLLFGCTLGLGYLAKAAMFPLGFVFLTSIALASAQPRRDATRSALALLAFLCVAAPFIFAISKSKGRLTFGESGKLNYAWHVNREGQFIHWQGGAHRAPAHPTRKIFDAPAAYEFETPLKVSYPPWYDPSYWNEGLRPRFDPRQQGVAVAENTRYFLKQYSYKSFPNGIVICLLLLLYPSRAWRAFARGLGSHLFLLLPALAAFAAYMLIHIEGRYVASFAVLLFMSLLASVSLPDTPKLRKVLPYAAAVVVIFLLLSTGASTFHALSNTFRQTPNAQVEVAEGLREMGVREGEGVASIGDAMLSSWPRLARVRVVAEIPYVVKGVSTPLETTGEVEKFWTADDATKAQVMEAFARAGARVVVANRIPKDAATEGWHKIGDTKHYVYFIR